MNLDEIKSRPMKMETLADILAVMRRGTRLPGYWRSSDLNKILQYHADHIEAAAERERGNLDALERACEEVLDAETLKAVVAAKRRIQEGGEK